MMLIVFLSSKISPLASTVIFLDRSPFATAVVTLAMFLTCGVRLACHVVHISPSSLSMCQNTFDVGLSAEFTFGTYFLATRVTSAANERAGPP